MTAPRSAMPFIMIAVLVDMITVGLIMPALPGWVGAFAGGPADQALWYGVVAFSFGFANCVAAPILGALSDCYGRRPILLLGIAGVIFSLALTSLSSALWMLVLARLIGGAMQANLAVAQAYVADITPARQLSARFGMLGAMMGLGLVLGPALGGALGKMGLRLPFVVAACLALLNWLYGYWILPESLPAERRAPFAWRRANVLVLVTGLFITPRARKLALAIGVNAAAQFSFGVIWVLYTQYRYGWGPRESGLSMAGIGLAALLVQGALATAASRRFPPAAISFIAMLCAAFAYLCFGLASAPWLMAPAVLLHASGFASAASMQALLAAEGNGSDQGRIFGATACMNALAGIVAPLLATASLRYVAPLAATDWRMGTPMFACAGLQLLAMMLMLSHNSHHKSAIK